MPSDSAPLFVPHGLSFTLSPTQNGHLSRGKPIWEAAKPRASPEDDELRGREGRRWTLSWKHVEPGCSLADADQQVGRKRKVEFRERSDHVTPERESEQFLCHLRIAHMHAQLLNHGWLFWDPTDYSLPGSSVHEISQARILQWVTISFSRRSSCPRDWTRASCIGR